MLLIACLLALASDPLIAKQPYVTLQERFSAEQMQATGLDTLSREQLDLLNSLLKDEISSTVKTEVEQARQESASTANLIGLNSEPVKSRLTGPISGWEPGTVFALENGQQWKVLKGKVTLHETLQSPEVKVVPGVGGRWFLQVVEDMPSARVYRID